jgi:undecaprenyl-diphosphatase
VVEYLDEFELNVCLRVNALSRRQILRRLFQIVSRLGDYPAWLVLGVGIAISQDNGTLDFALQAIATGLIGVLVYKALKERLVRERPYVTHGQIICGTAPLDRYSFPSGHTLHAVSLTILYGAYEPVLLVVMVPFAVLVAASRIVLGLHYPSDVVAGALIGALLASVSLALAG